MKNTPILFNGAMVRAILEGRKSVTRRIVNLPLIDPNFGCELAGSEINNANDLNLCPFGTIGDRLWCKETFLINHMDFYYPGSNLKTRPEGIDLENSLLYRADGTCCQQLGECDCEGHTNWRPSIHMPRWASRITLEITGIKVERVQEITPTSAISEGIDYASHKCGCEFCSRTSQICPATASSLIMEFASLWNSTTSKPELKWEADPFVWCLEFRRIEK